MSVLRYLIGSLPAALFRHDYSLHSSLFCTEYCDPGWNLSSNEWRCLSRFCYFCTSQGPSCLFALCMCASSDTLSQAAAFFAHSGSEWFFADMFMKVNANFSICGLTKWSILAKCPFGSTSPCAPTPGLVEPLCGS